MAGEEAAPLWDYLAFLKPSLSDFIANGPAASVSSVQTLTARNLQEAPKCGGKNWLLKIIHIEWRNFGIHEGPRGTWVTL